MYPGEISVGIFRKRLLNGDVLKSNSAAVCREMVPVFGSEIMRQCRRCHAGAGQEVLQEVVFCCRIGNAKIAEFAVKPFSGRFIGMYQRLILKASFSVYRRMKCYSEEQLNTLPCCDFVFKNINE